MHEVSPDEPFRPDASEAYSVSEYSENPVAYIQQYGSQHGARRSYDEIIEARPDVPTLMLVPPPQPMVTPVETTTTALIHQPGQPPVYQTTSTTHVEPLNPPGPSTPKIRSAKTVELTPRFGTKPSGKKIAEAEERALRAQHIAALKEQRALETRSLADQKEAIKARRRANELLLRAEETEKKERKKRRGSIGARLTVGKNARGETVIIQK